MSDFGGLAKDAVEWSGAKEFLTYQNVMDSLSATFGDHRNLVYNFPTSAIMPQDYIGSGQDRMYNFRWEAEKIYRFRGAHWSNIRITPSFLKTKGVQKDVQNAVKRIESGGSKSKRKAIEQEIKTSIEGRLQSKYQDKLTALLDKSNSAPGSPYDSRRKYYIDKFNLGKEHANDGPGSLATAIAKQVVTNSAKYKKALEKVTDAEYARRFEKLVGSPERAGDKQTKMMSSKATRGFLKSTFVAYEIQYEVLRIAKNDVIDRFDELERQLKKAKAKRSNALKQEQDRLRQQFNELTRSLGSRYGGDLTDTDKEAIRAQITAVKEDQEGLQKEIAGLEKEFEGYQRRLHEHRELVWGLMETRRRIGKFAIYPVGECDGDETTIRWRNTDASLKATCMGLSDGRVRVNLDWSEKSFLSIPGLPKELTSNTYAINGGMKFDKDGEYEVDGKLGKRFQALAGKVQPQMLGEGEYPGPNPWAKSDNAE